MKHCLVEWTVMMMLFLCYLYELGKLNRIPYYNYVIFQNTNRYVNRFCIASDNEYILLLLLYMYSKYNLFEDTI